METDTDAEARAATDATPDAGTGTQDELRRRLLDGAPAVERREVLAGVPTSFLEAGPEEAPDGSAGRASGTAGAGGARGAPLVLLHGPGESAVKWRWALPELVGEHRVIAPDLPAHGRTGGADEELDAARTLDWLEALVARCCPKPPVLVGHVLGGALAARYAAAGRGGIRGLVLVDALGLARFRPSLRFLLTMLGFQVRPTETTYRWFMGQCAYDREALTERMGDRWKTFVAYNVELARSPKSKAAGRLFRSLGLPRIPPEELERIAVPTALVWGRHDRALPLRIAEEASERHGWPLRVVEEVADDPPRDRPEAFARALAELLAGFGPPGAGRAAAGSGRLPRRTSSAGPGHLPERTSLS